MNEIKNNMEIKKKNAISLLDTQKDKTIGR